MPRGNDIKVGLIFQAFDKVTGPLNKINAKLRGFTAPMRKLGRSISDLAESSGLNRISTAAVGVGTAFSSLAVTGGLAAVGVYKLVDKAAAAADDLWELHTATGMSVESLQTLGRAFAQSGGNAEDWRGTVVKFSKGFGDLRRNSGGLYNILKKSNPQMLAALKRTQDTGEAMRIVIGGISSAKTDAAKIAISAAAFGKAAPVGIVNLAKLGKEGLAELEAEMAKLGIMTAEQAKLGGDAKDSMQKVWMTISQALTTVVIPFLPAIKELSEQFSKTLIEKPELIKTVLTAIAAIVGGKLIGSIGALAISLAQLSWALISTPAGWFIAAIAAIAGLAYVLIYKWDAVREFFSKLWDKPLGKFLLLTTPIAWLVYAAGWIINNWVKVRDFFVRIWNSPIAKLWKLMNPLFVLIDLGSKMGVWKAVGSFFEQTANAVDYLLTKIEALWDAMTANKAVRWMFGFGDVAPGQWNPQGQSKGNNLGVFKNLAGKSAGQKPLMVDTIKKEIVEKTIPYNAKIDVNINGPVGTRVTTDAPSGLKMNVNTSTVGTQGESY